MKHLLEKIFRGIFTCSGFVSSMIILLIVVFLFGEAMGLFSQKVVDSGYVLAVHPQNPVRELSPEQIKEIFDADITNWKQVGGKEGEITLFRLEDLSRHYDEKSLGADYQLAGSKIKDLIDQTPGILAFVPESVMKDQGELTQIRNRNISLTDVLMGTEWFPTATPSPLFGIIPLLAGTLWVCFGAILIALPFGLGVAVYMAELAPQRIRRMLKPVVELLNGIPSVVYGFFGLIVIVPLLQKGLGLPVGESGLAGCIVLAIMALPTIITVSEDAIGSCPRSVKEASLALGATHWQTIRRVIIPHSASGITSGVVLGIGRAVGETMAVLMVTGNAAIIPAFITEPLRTIPATIAAELGEAPTAGAHYQSLFLLGVVLFFITLIINLSVEYISSKNRIK